MIIKSSSPTKDGRAWQFRAWYTDSLGHRKQYNSKKYETKKEAQQEEARFMLSQKLDGKSMTIGQIVPLFLENCKTYARKNTLQSYTKSLQYFEKFYSVKINEFNVAHYQDFLKSVEHLSPSSINTYIRSFRVLLKFADEQLNIDVSKQYKIVKLVKNADSFDRDLHYYTREQLKVIQAQSKYPELFTTLYYCGLRIGEARGLQWSDVDLENKTISVSKQISARESIYSVPTPCKTSTSIRVVPLFNDVLIALKSLYASQTQCKGFNSNWYVFGNSKAFCTKLIDEDLQRVCEANGFESLGCHAFRHSCASWLLSNGASIYLVSKYLGHGSVDLTSKVYAHLLPNTLNDLITFIEKNSSKG